jgi:predicted glycogen debranching enzyme
MSQFDQSVCRDLDVASRREWLETNGLGGFASSTITGLNTRRYHGLLVAATKPAQRALRRMVLLSKMEETLVIDGRRFDLSCNRYPGVVHPQGHTHLKQFRQDPFPVFLYEVNGLELEKSVFMVHGENTTVIQYQLRGAVKGPCTLELRPLIAFRDYHSTTHENSSLNPSLAIEPGRVTCSPYQECPDLHFAHNAAEVKQAGHWYRNFEYSVEEQRGLDYQEDLFNPLVLTFDLNCDPRAAVIASTEDASAEARTAESADYLRSAEIQRRADVLAAAPAHDLFVQSLVQSADQFIVRRGDQSTVIAGYHWFTDWGRDTMIALPGLTVATGRYEDARSILLAFAASVDRGMLPNRFPEAGETPEYNTVDATLWFFEAVRAFAAYTEDYKFIRTKLYEVLVDIISWHQRGTRYGIRLDTDGLLLAGEPGVQLTWMDAKVGDWVVTPRHGKPVEIEALWYNALRMMEDLAQRFGDDIAGAHYKQLAERARNSFCEQFWNESTGCLFDVIDGDSRDGAIRPNQIFAVSLFHGMLSREKAMSVTAAAERHLLTPYGLRSLAPSDPQYRGRYEGNPWSRDSAYHQGTVWPWLMGPVPHRVSQGQWAVCHGAQTGRRMAVGIPAIHRRRGSRSDSRSLRRRCAASKWGLSRTGLERGGTDPEPYGGHFCSPACPAGCCSGGNPLMGAVGCGLGSLEHELWRVEIRCGAQTKGDGIGEFRQPDHHDGFQNLLVRVTVGV